MQFSRFRQLSRWGAITLLLLRLVIGFHFLMEGWNKVSEGGFTSRGFLGSANGPLAEKFRGMIPDYYGFYRLNSDLMSSSFDNHFAAATAGYSFNGEQTKLAEQILKQHKNQLKWVFREYKSDIYKYTRGYERIAKLNLDPKNSGAEGNLRSQADQIRSEWEALGKPAISAIDQVVESFKSEIDAIATENQRAAVSVNYVLPNTAPLNSDVVDKIIPIFDMVVGILLMIGLLTPVAAIAAAIFLGSVILTQFPGAIGSQPTYYQAIEMVACLVLAVCDAGRYAGLDFFGWSFWERLRERKLEQAY